MFALFTFYFLLFQATGWDAGKAIANQSESPTGRAQIANRKSACPADLETLVAQLLPDLPSYTNRVVQRANDIYVPRYIILASQPEFEPLPLGPGRTTTDGSVIPEVDQLAGRRPDDPRQVFITTLERQYTGGQMVEIQQFHWLFLTQTTEGWGLALMFSRIGSYPAGEPPTPPQESSNSAIAQAIRLWLRNCKARAV